VERGVRLAKWLPSPATSLSPEFLLAAACARWPHSKGRAEAIRAQVDKVIDWAHFLRVVKRHGVVGLVHDGLTRAQAQVPADVYREIKFQALATVGESLSMAAEASRLQRLFEDAGIFVIFLKGSALAKLAYGNLGLRVAKDIDLLVSPEALPSAKALIERTGYRRFDPPPDIGCGQFLMSLRKDIGFIHEVTGQQIELHWRLFLNPYSMDEATVMPLSRFVPLAGTTGLRTLGEEDLFTYLSVHGALHSWNQLKWLADIGALVANALENDAERLYSAAEVRGAGRPAAQAILLCQRLLDAHPAPIIKSIARGSSVRWLEATALRAITAGREEQTPHDVRFGTTLGSLSGFLLRQSWTYRWVELRNLLMNETDVLTIPLPKHLRWLYPLMRLPLWIWRHARRSAK
jgi:Uncharacterised nucleotidyltransferase